MSLQSPRIWFITGSSLGFGRSMTVNALDAGDFVFATVRRIDSLADLQAAYPERLYVHRLDVTREEDIPLAFTKAKEVFGRIDIVFNNAGTSVCGEIEAVPKKASRDLVETNFWGAYDVTRAAIGFFRDVNRPAGGRLLQMCSYYGIVAQPGLGIYVATKHAIEGLTSSLVDELEPTWNIKVTLVEPGYFRTDLFSQRRYEIFEHPSYTDPKVPGAAFRLACANLRPETIKGDPDKLSKALLKLSHLEDPPKRLIIGKEAVESVKAKLAEIENELLKYESWSDDIEFDDYRTKGDQLQGKSKL